SSGSRGPCTPNGCGLCRRITSCRRGADEQDPGMNRPVAYITRSSVCLPNAPVENDQVEAILGRVGERPSRARRVVQRSNGIRQRYYVIDPVTGKPNYTNASLTAAAVKGLTGNGFALDDLACLVCGTSNPDQLIPNHAVMVHGELGVPICEAVATAGVCVSGATALKYGWMLYSAREREANSVFALKQDVRLLNDEVIAHTLVKPLARVIAHRGLSPGDVDWLLPHYSSEYFRAPVAGGLARAGLPVPQERWFTNLERVGNVGSASVYIMLDELLRSGRLRD